MAITSAGTDLEILCADGTTWLPLTIAAPRDRAGNAVDGAPKTLSEALAAAGNDVPLSNWLESVIQEGWSGGLGVDYSAAAGVDTWSSPGYALPAGAATELTVTASSNSASPLVAFAEYGGDLWVAQVGAGGANQGRVMRSAGGTGALSNSLNLGAGEYVFDLLVADDGAGTKVLWASSSSAAHASGRMHKWDGATWTSTAAATFGTWGRNAMVSAFWEDEDGIGATRIITASSAQGHISYTKPNADPLLAASWVEGVRTSATATVNLTAARRHAYMRDAANVYDLNEQGDTPALLAESTAFFGSGAGFPGKGPAVAYVDGYVYYSHAVGLGRVYVGDGPLLQSDPGTCSPGYLTASESPYTTGYNSALLPYQGGIFAAMFPYSVGLPLVFWGRDRKHYPDVKTDCPLVWHGPFIVGTEPAVITAMAVQTLLSAPSQTRMLLASWNVSQLAEPRLAWVSLPAVGGAMAGLAASSLHRFATGAGSPLYNATCRLELLPDTHGDKDSLKFAYKDTYGSRGLNDASDPKLTVYTRADADPASSSWGTGTDVATSPTQSVTPPTTSGHKLETRIDFFSPNGGSTPPKPAVLDSVKRNVWRTGPDLEVKTLEVEYGVGVTELGGGDWSARGLSVDYYTDRLLELCRGDRTTLRDRQGNRRSVKLRHVLNRAVTLTDEQYGKAVAATLVFADLGAA